MSSIGRKPLIGHLDGKIIRIIRYGQIGDLIRRRFRRTEDNRLASANIRARNSTLALLFALTDEYAVRIPVLIRLAKLRNAYRNVLLAVSATKILSLGISLTQSDTLIKSAIAIVF